MLLPGKASLLSKTIVSITIKLVRILVMFRIVRNRFDWTADICTFWNDSAVREAEVFEKDALAEDWEGSARLSLITRDILV